MSQKTRSQGGTLEDAETGRETLGAALGRGMDKVFGDQPDSATKGQQSSRDLLWEADTAAAALPPELRGDNPPD